MKKGKRDYHSSFVRLGRDLIFRSDNWAILTPRAKVAYLTLKGKYNGSNNGELRLCYSKLKRQSGFRSPKSISKVLRELAEVHRDELEEAIADYPRRSRHYDPARRG